jgi:hypothetical protein
MSDGAFAHGFCSDSERATVLVQSVAALAGTKALRLYVETLHEPLRWIDDVRCAELPEVVKHVLVPGTLISVSFACELPSGRQVTASVVVADDVYRERTRDKAGPVVLRVERRALFLAQAKRPRFVTFEPAGAAALAEEELRGDVAWLLERLLSALGQTPNSPVVLGFSGDWLPAHAAFGVRHRNLDTVTRDFATDWLATRAGFLPVTLVDLAMSELRLLVAESRIVTEGQQGGIRLDRQQVLKLLDCSPQQVRAALETLAVADERQQRLDDLANQVRETQLVASDMELVEPDWKERERLFADVPWWRVTMEVDGSVNIVTTPNKSLADFYALLAELLLAH